MADNILLWTWLVMVFSPANKRLWELSANFDNEKDFVTALKNHDITQATDAEYERVDKISFEDAEKVLHNCDELNINYYCYKSEGYPEQLRKIANPPAVIFTKGNLDFLNDKCIITVVGTRKPSGYSLEITEKLCSQLIERNFVLASGFANGIDQKVNRISLANKSIPVAVCGTPLNSDYPQGSDEIKEKIVQNGVLISEYYPNCKIHGGSFTNRNRISVGISSGVLFIEAGRDSHGLDNYNHAVYQGKPVFVVPPHDIYDSRYYGQRDLIRNECQTVFDADDIVFAIKNDKHYDIKYLKSVGEYNLPADDSVFYKSDDEKIKVKKPRKHKSQKDENNKPEIKEIIQVDYSTLDEIQTKIVRLLEQKNMLADEIAAQTEMNITDVLAELTELEMFGVVKSLPGKMFGL